MLSIEPVGVAFRATGKAFPITTVKKARQMSPVSLGGESL
jgi:hypothetical protein